MYTIGFVGVIVGKAFEALCVDLCIVVWPVHVQRSRHIPFGDRTHHVGCVLFTALFDVSDFPNGWPKNRFENAGTAAWRAVVRCITAGRSSHFRIRRGVHRCGEYYAPGLREIGVCGNPDIASVEHVSIVAGDPPFRFPRAR